MSFETSLFTGQSKLFQGTKQYEGSEHGTAENAEESGMACSVGMEGTDDEIVCVADITVAADAMNI
jgi:hypothetical protein